MREGDRLWKEERKGGRQEGGLVPGALFSDGQVDHGSITVAKDAGRRLSCRGKMMRSVLDLLGLSPMENI